MLKTLLIEPTGTFQVGHFPLTVQKLTSSFAKLSYKEQNFNTFTKTYLVHIVYLKTSLNGLLVCKIPANTNY